MNHLAPLGVSECEICFKTSATRFSMGCQPLFPKNKRRNENLPEVNHLKQLIIDCFWESMYVYIYIYIFNSFDCIIQYAQKFPLESSPINSTQLAFSLATAPIHLSKSLRNDPPLYEEEIQQDTMKYIYKWSIVPLPS